MKLVLRILSVCALILLFAAGTIFVSGNPASPGLGKGNSGIQITHTGSIGCYGYFSKHCLPLKLLTKIRARAWQNDGSWGLPVELTFRLRDVVEHICSPACEGALPALAGSWPDTTRLRGPPSARFS